MHLYAKKAPALKAHSSKIFRKMFLLILACLIFNVAHSQMSLKITKMKQVTWSSYSNAWSPWPVDWRSYQRGAEPVITLYSLDDDGYKFRVITDINGQSFLFDVTFAGYDANNNWSKYKDVNGDEVDISGSTMTKLAMYGWPDSVVQIYFWIYSKGMGLVLE